MDSKSNRGEDKSRSRSLGKFLSRGRILRGRKVGAGYGQDLDRSDGGVGARFYCSRSIDETRSRRSSKCRSLGKKIINWFSSPREDQVANILCERTFPGWSRTCRSNSLNATKKMNHNQMSCRI